MSRPVLISIEGNIGSGKSTLFRTLQKRHPDWHFVAEPVDAWLQLKNEKGESLLELFYADKRRWSYTFQNTALLTRAENLKIAIQTWRDKGCPGSNIFVTERCILTDYHVFAASLADEGMLDSLEHFLYCKWFDMVSEDILMPSGFVYVKADPEICDLRIHRRARDGEERIPVEYLRTLDTAHESWLSTTPTTIYTCVNNTEHRVSDDFGILEPRETLWTSIQAVESFITGLQR